MAELSQANRKLEATLLENAGLHEQLLTQAREAGGSPSASGWPGRFTTRWRQGWPGSLRDDGVSFDPAMAGPVAVGGSRSEPDGSARNGSSQRQRVKQQRAVGGGSRCRQRLRAAGHATADRGRGWDAGDRILDRRDVQTWRPRPCPCPDHL